MQLIVDQPWDMQESEQLSYRFPYIACELFKCGNPAVTRTLLQGSATLPPGPGHGYTSPEEAQEALETGKVPPMRHVHRLFCVLPPGAPAQEYRVSYAAQVLEALCKSHTLQTIAAVTTAPIPLVRRILLHADVQAVTRLLQLLTSLPWPAASLPVAGLGLTEADVRKAGTLPLVHFVTTCLGGAGPGSSAVAHLGAVQAHCAELGFTSMACIAKATASRLPQAAVEQAVQEAARRSADTAAVLVDELLQQAVVVPHRHFGGDVGSAGPTPLGSTTEKETALPFAGLVPVGVRAHAASVLDAGFYAPGVEVASGGCTPTVAGHLLRHLQWSDGPVQALARALVRCVLGHSSQGAEAPQATLSEVCAGRVSALKAPQLSPGTVTTALGLVGLDAASVAAPWRHGTAILQALSGLVRLAARTVGGVLGSGAPSQVAALPPPPLVDMLLDLLPLMTEFLTAAATEAEHAASTLPPAPAGQSTVAAPVSLISGRRVVGEAHHLPRLGQCAAAVAEIVAGLLLCQWQGTGESMGVSCTVLLQCVEAFPWASLLHRTVFSALEAVVMQGSDEGKEAVLVQGGLPSWLVRMAKAQCLPGDIGNMYAGSPSHTVGFVGHAMAAAAAVAAAQQAKTLPTAVSQHLEQTPGWTAFVGGMLCVHIMRQSVAIGGPVPSGKNLSGDAVPDLKVDEVPV